MRLKLFAHLLIVICAGTTLAGCNRTLDRYEVRDFVDQADNAARKRFAPEVCELRGKNFRMHLTFHAEGESEPSELEINRSLFCRQAGELARLRQYKLERKSIEIKLAPDEKTAIVRAEYVETMPYYGEYSRPATPDDFQEWQIIESLDESIVGIEDGNLVFLSTDAESHQSLVSKGEIKLPYN